MATPMSPRGEIKASKNRVALPSPLLVYDWASIETKLRLFKDIVASVDGTFLYSIKAQPFSGLLTRMTPWVGGFAVSSLFEARLVQAALQLLVAERKVEPLKPPRVDLAQLQAGDLTQNVPLRDGDTVNVPIPPALTANNISEGGTVQLQNPSLTNAQIVLTVVP